MPHELFAIMRLSATTTPSEAAESIGSNSTISDDHHQELSSSSSARFVLSSHHKQCQKRSHPWSFESDQPPETFLFKKRKSLPSSVPTSSSSSTNLSFAVRKRSLTAATTTSSEPATKKLKPRKTYDLEGFSACRIRFSTTSGPSVTTTHVDQINIL